MCLVVLFGVERWKNEHRTTALLNRVSGLEQTVHDAPPVLVDDGKGGHKLGSSTPWGCDLAGSTNVCQTAAKINGSSIPAGGSLTPGNTLGVTGASALGYSALNLAGGAGYVTGLLPVANVAPGTAGQIAVSNATPNFAWTSLVTYDTTHGTWAVGNGGSDTVAWVGPYAANETTDAALFLLQHGATRNNSNFVVAFGTAIVDAYASHAGSVALNAPGRGGVYGDILVTNANGNAGTLESLARWDGISGNLFSFYGITTASSGASGVTITNSGTPIIPRAAARSAYHAAAPKCLLARAATAAACASATVLSMANAPTTGPKPLPPSTAAKAGPSATTRILGSGSAMPATKRRTYAGSSCMPWVSTPRRFAAIRQSATIRA